jgi:hypothetical protein
VELDGVTAAARNHAWAAGRIAPADDQTSRTYILTWDGKSWSVERSASPSAQLNNLDSVSSCGPDCAWTVGLQAQNHQLIPLIERLSGTRWQTVPYGAHFALDGPMGVAALSPHNVWIVGDRSTRTSRAIAMHWNGNRLASAAVQRPGWSAGFFATSANASGDLWAVGEAETRTGRENAFGEQWDGQGWVLR